MKTNDSTATGFRAILAGILLLSTATAARAGVQGGASSCAQNQAGVSLGCTAKDVNIATMELLEVVDGCTSTADTAQVKLKIYLSVNAAQRYDIGAYIATDGGDGKTGACFKEYLPPPLVPSPTVAQLASGFGPYWDGGADGDACGDGKSNDPAIDPIVRILSQSGSSSTPQTITIPCTDMDANGFVDVGFVVGWRGTSRADCSGIAQAGIPQTSSKCSMGRSNLNLKIGGGAANTLPPVLTVAKTVMPATGTCGVDDRDTISVTKGSQVKYCYRVTNSTAATAAWDVQLVDDMGTPGTPGDDQTITLSGLTAIGGTAGTNDLAGGATPTGTS